MSIVETDWEMALRPFIGRSVTISNRGGPVRRPNQKGTILAISRTGDGAIDIKVAEGHTMQLFPDTLTKTHVEGSVYKGSHVRRRFIFNNPGAKPT